MAPTIDPSEEASMSTTESVMDLVKYEWVNAHGVAFTDYRLTCTGADPFIYHGTVTDWRVLEREPLPESIRETGRASVVTAHVRNALRGERPSAAEFVRRMGAGS